MKWSDHRLKWWYTHIAKIAFTPAERKLLLPSTRVVFYRRPMKWQIKRDNHWGLGASSTDDNHPVRNAIYISTDNVHPDTKILTLIHEMLHLCYPQYSGRCTDRKFQKMVATRAVLFGIL